MRSKNRLFARLGILDTIVEEDETTQDMMEITWDRISGSLVSVFIQAASRGDLDTVQQCLEFDEHFDINAKDDTNTSALVYAASMGYFDVVQSLVQHGAVLEEKEAKWVTLLAITNGYYEIFNLIQNEFIDFTDSEYEETIVDEIIDTNNTESLDDSETRVVDDARLSLANPSVEGDQPGFRDFVDHASIERILKIAIQRIIPSPKKHVTLGANVIYVYCQSLYTSANYRFTNEFLTRGIEMIQEWALVSRVN